MTIPRPPKKIDKRTLDVFREMAKLLPSYHEIYIQRKHIHHDDIETNNIHVKGGINKLEEYDYGFNDGKRLVNADVHFKRMKNAFKKEGMKGYRDYLWKISELKVEPLNLWDKLMVKLNWN